MNNKKIIFIVIFFLVSLTIGIYKLSFIEFKNDQLYAIEMGNYARQHHFLLTHGVTSGIGINNPPHFSYLMGLLTYFFQNPLYISAILLLIAMLGLILVLHYFSIRIPTIYALLASSILVLSPSFITYTTYIWPFSFIMLLMSLYHRSFYTLITNKNGNSFVVLAIITAIVSQLHMSGFFLFLPLVLTRYYYRKKIPTGVFLVSIITVFLIFLPYLYHLFFDRELEKFISFANLSQRHIYWKIFREHIRMASFDFFRYYFRYDFNAVLNKSVGKIWLIIYPLSCILIALFVFGFLAYLSWLIRNKKIFDTAPQMQSKYPLAFQISGFVVLTVTLGYLIFHIQAPPHYLIILFPSYAILTAFPAYKMWKFFWAKIVITASILATGFLLVAVLVFVKKAGGHPHEYGPHYGTLLEWRRLVWSKVPAESCPDLSLAGIVKKGADKLDKDTIYSVIMANRTCDKSSRKIPLRLTVKWDEQLMRYNYKVDVLKKGD